MTANVVKFPKPNTHIHQQQAVLRGVGQRGAFLHQRVIRVAVVKFKHRGGMMGYRCIHSGRCAAGARFTFQSRSASRTTSLLEA